MAEHNQEGQGESELDVELNLARQVQDLKRRMTHLETLEGGSSFSTVLDINTTAVLISNTVAETTVFSESIPGGTLDIVNGLQLLLLGILRNGSGGARTLTTRLKYGASTLLSSAISIPTGSAESFVWNGWIFATGGTSSQFGEMLGLHTTAPDVISLNRGVSAVDSTVAQTLEMTIQFSFAHANLVWDKRVALLQHFINP